MTSTRAITVPLSVIVDGVVDQINSVSIVLSSGEVKQVSRLGVLVNNAIHDAEALQVQLAACRGVFIELGVLLIEESVERRAPVATK